MENKIAVSTDAYIARLHKDLQLITWELCKIARECMLGAVELIAHGAIGYSMTRSSFDRFCYIASQRGYVNLGFFFGANLPDPDHLLVGEGIRMRHIKIKNVDEVRNPAVVQILRAAWEDAPASVAGIHKKRAGS